MDKACEPSSSLGHGLNLFQPFKMIFHFFGRSSQSFLAKQREHKSSLCMDRDRHWSFDYCCWEHKWLQCCKCHWRKWEAPSWRGLGCYLYPEASWDEIIILWLSDHLHTLTCCFLTPLRGLLLKERRFFISLLIYFPSAPSSFHYGYLCFAMVLADLPLQTLWKVCTHTE